MSRLDIFLITDNMGSIWKLNNQVVGKRVLSNHCPVWLKAGGCEWGPNLLGSTMAGINTKTLTLS